VDEQMLHNFEATQKLLNKYCIMIFNLADHFRQNVPSPVGSEVSLNHVCGVMPDLSLQKIK
jgi:hypothetical protein